MGKLFTREQARAFLKEGNFKDGDAIADALTEGFKDLIQEALETELDNKLGYSKYDWKKNKGSFASDEALLKALYLAVMDRTQKWTLPLQNWAQILQQPEAYYGKRIAEFI